MKKEKLKTYRERAEYLTSIKPLASMVYHGIADFFGENEIPPQFKKKIKTYRKKI